MLREPVGSFQDINECDWHLLRSRGNSNGRNSGSLRRDWVWILAGGEDSFGVLKGRTAASLWMLLKLRDPRSGKTMRLGVVESLLAEKGGQVDETSGLVTVGKRCNGTTRKLQVVICLFSHVCYLVRRTSNGW
jgi:hypothetical protein